MKEKTKTIRSWDELIKFVNSTNPYKKTIIMTGFTNEVDGQKLIIRELIFTTADVSILKENGKQSKTKGI